MRQLLRQRRQSTSAHVALERCSDCVHWFQTPGLERAVDGHQDRLRLRPGLAAVAQRVLAHDDRRSDLPLRVVVVRRHVLVVQESEQRIPIPSQPFDQALDVRAGRLPVHQTHQALVDQPRAALLVISARGRDRVVCVIRDACWYDTLPPRALRRYPCINIGTQMHAISWEWSCCLI